MEMEMEMEICRISFFNYLLIIMPCLFVASAVAVLALVTIIILFVVVDVIIVVIVILYMLSTRLDFFQRYDALQ